jgi:hypothetical protein
MQATWLVDYYIEPLLFALSRILARIAPDHGAPVFWTWLASPLVLAEAVAIASVLPARRSLIVDPLTLNSRVPKSPLTDCCW